MKLLFDAIANELNGVPFSPSALSDGDFSVFVKLAAAQKILPIAGEALLVSGGSAITEDMRVKLRAAVTRLVASQTLQTNAFSELYRRLDVSGLRPCVVKGVVCARLYPLPDSRLSGDSDLLILPDEAEKYICLLEELGFKRTKEVDGSDGGFEMTFVRRDGLRTEVHTSLFAPCGRTAELNAVLGDALSDCSECTVNGVSIRTLSPSRHLLYLILHAFKHFVMSGFGIRQVCDIALFSREYVTEIDLKHVADSLFAVRAADFTSAVFGLAVRYLGFSPTDFEPLASLLPQDIDFEPLAADIVSGGIYGGDIERQHAATVTLNAFDGGNEENKAGFRSVFPDRRYMADKYPFVKKSSLLLPAAWCARIARYAVESSKNGRKASDSLKIGRRRTDLLKYYGIID